MARYAWIGLLVISIGGCSSPPAAVLYVVNRGSDDVSAYAIDMTTGALARIKGSPFRAGSAPGAIAMAGGRFVYVTNQFSKNVSAYRVEASGALTPIEGSPFATYAFPLSVALGGSGRFAYVTSAAMPEGEGRVAIHTVDATSGALTLVTGMDATTGAGPVAVAVTADGYVFVANLLSHDISGYEAEAATGRLAPMAGSPFPAYRVRVGGPSPVSPFAGVASPPMPTIEVPHRAASIVVAPSGIVYVVGYTLALPIAVTAGGRGPSGNVSRDAGARAAATAMSSLSGYTFNRFAGTLTPLEASPWSAGRRPTEIALTPAARFAYVANLESDDVSAFAVDPATGVLTEVAGSPFRAGTRPSALAVDRRGRFLYVANAGSNDISVFAIDEASGALRVVGNAPVKTGTEPIAMAGG